MTGDATGASPWAVEPWGGSDIPAGGSEDRGGQAEGHDEPSWDAHPTGWYEQITPPVEEDPWADLVPPPEPPQPAHPAVVRAVDAGWALTEPETLDPEKLWGTHPALGRIHDYARARGGTPWAVFGAVLTRLCAALEPNIQLPPVIYGPASLNLFVALVGPSGSGKDGAVDIARDAAVLYDLNGTQKDIPEVPIGSGEGLSDVYMRVPGRRNPRQEDGLRDLDADQPDVAGVGAVQWRTRALIVINEIDTLDAMMQRRGATVAGQLRQAYSGQQLGFFYRDKEKRLMAPRHRYRMGLLAGVQPGRGRALLDDTDGGTPQRFLWLPTLDPDVPDEPPPPTHGLALQVPDFAAVTYFELCPEAADTIRRADVERKRGKVDALDGHALLTREKVAALLALLDDQRPLNRRCVITADDWQVSALVMAKSDQTRQGVIDHLKRSAARENTQKAEAEATRTLIIQQAQEEDQTRKATRAVRTRLARLRLQAQDGQGDGWATHRELRNSLRGNHRPYLDDALNRLLDAGSVQEDRTATSSSNGASQHRYRLTEEG